MKIIIFFFIACVFNCYGQYSTDTVEDYIDEEYVYGKKIQCCKSSIKHDNRRYWSRDWNENGLCGFIDEKGNVKIEYKFESASSDFFGDGTAWIKSNKKSFLINQKGDIISKGYDCIYMALEYYKNCNLHIAGIKDENGKRLYGVIDKNDSTIIPFKYRFIDDDMFMQCYGIIKACKDDSCYDYYGFNGNLIVSCDGSYGFYTFDETCDGLIVKEIDGNMYILNINGNAVKIEGKYDSYGNFYKSKYLIAYKNEGEKMRIGALDLQAEEVLSCIYEDINIVESILDGFD